MSDRYQKSDALLKRALGIIPLGTQTFSKSKTQYPWGVSPFFIAKAEGSHVWDVDGHEYIDFVNGLAAITLGYNDPDVNRAVQKQLEQGVIFSLPHPIEIEAAEEITKMIPCAEMVRFGKNGSDATAGAVRLARAYAKRDHIAVCGYHGWQDWYIGTTSRSLGVPEATRKLTHKFTFNDLDSLRAIFKEWPGQVAAVMMEPMNMTEPKTGFLESVKELAHEQGSLLIFDETITGFRFSNGGAQDYFHVTADLATFGKGIANGYPLSAVTGPANIMHLMEEIFFSFTFGGETLSLAASTATLRKLQAEPILQTIGQRGSHLLQGVQERIARYGLNGILAISGHPSWSFLNIQDAAAYKSWQIKSLFLQEMFARGILMIGTHNMSYAHSEKDVGSLLAVYDHVFPLLKEVVEKKTLERRLHCKPLEPLFKIR